MGESASTHDPSKKLTIVYSANKKKRKVGAYVLGSSGTSWTKQSAPRSRQITTPTPHHSIFTGQMLSLTHNQQCQSKK